MLSRIAPLVLLLPGLAGCVAQAETAPVDDPPAAEASDDTPAPPPTDPYAQGDGYQSPCVTGQVMILGGQPVWVPVPCTADTVDKGDPPPFEERQHDPSLVEKKAAAY